MNSSSSPFMELRNKRKFETSDNNEEFKEICTSDVNTNVSEGTTMITMKSKKFNILNYEFIDFNELKNRDKIHQE
jgi:viroplasmin and RNaseH domain-containing protein